MSTQTPYSAAFRRNLRIVMWDRGIGIAELSRISGVTAATIDRVLWNRELVKHVSLEVALNLTHALDLSLDDMLADRACDHPSVGQKPWQRKKGPGKGYCLRCGDWPVPFNIEDGTPVPVGY